MSRFLKLLKKYYIGFVCIYKLKEHHTGALYRIFFYSETGLVTIFWHDGDKFTCKGKKFIDKIASNSKIMAYNRV